MSTTLEDIFSGDPIEPKTEAEPAEPAKAEPAPEPDPAPTASTEDPASPAPTGEPAEPSGEEGEPAAPETRMVPHAALHEERTRRQKAEEKYSELSGQVGQLLPHLPKMAGGESKADAEPKLPTDFYADPSGYVTANLESLEGRFNKALGSLAMNLSENAARARHEDYDEVLQVFAGMVKETPLLAHQLRQQANPAEWAYRQGLDRQKLGDAPDLTAYEKNLRAQWEAEQAEAQKKAAEETGEPADPPAAPAPNIPQSLATARNAGTRPRKGPAFSGPTPLTEVLAEVPGRKKRG